MARCDGETHHALARVIDFRNGIGPDGKPNNRFLAVRELKVQGVRAPDYNRRATSYVLSTAFRWWLSS